MGIAGAGNSGTVLAVLFAPPLATKFGWQTVWHCCSDHGAATIVMAVLAKEPPDREHRLSARHIACLV